MTTNLPIVRTLLVEDETADAQIVSIFLQRSEDEQFDVSHATHLAKALALVHDHEFEVILLDLGLPDSANLDSVRKLKAAAPDTPIVVFTGNEDEELALAAIEAGAQEYLSKSHVVGQLLTRVVRHSIARQRQLQAAVNQALTDPLTGIGNRRAFDMELSRRFMEWKRNQLPFSVGIIDIDHFKSVNDNYGHDVGDQALKHVCQLVEANLRQSDMVARTGGEEFAVIFPDSNIESAYRVLDRMREAVELTPFELGDQKLDISISGGVAEIREDNAPEKVVQCADQALYAAKEDGRNCCRKELEMCLQDSQASAI